MRWVIRLTSYLESSCRHASGWMRERTLDSHCGENDGAVGGNDDDKALRKGRRRTEWTGRRPTWSVPADPLQVGWEKGLWIPTAVRMTEGRG